MSTDKSNNDEQMDGRISHAETGLLWRCARQMLNDGNPAPEIVLSHVTLDDEAYPCLAMTLTNRDRLVCWGILPPELRTSAEAGRLRLTDHVTVELSNRRVHATSYGEDNSARHDTRGWKLISYEKNGLSFAFGFAARVSTMQSQLTDTSREIRTPASDNQRRIEEFRNFAGKVKHRELKYTPADNISQDWVLGLVYVIDREKPTFSPSAIPPLKEWFDASVDDWEDDEKYGLMPNLIQVGSLQIVICVGLPPGRLRLESFVFGQARRL